MSEMHPGSEDSSVTFEGTLRGDGKPLPVWGEQWEMARILDTLSLGQQQHI